jgi:hypothetical protein
MPKSTVAFFVFVFIGDRNTYLGVFCFNVINSAQHVLRNENPSVRDLLATVLLSRRSREQGSRREFEVQGRSNSKYSEFGGTAQLCRI